MINPDNPTGPINSSTEEKKKGQYRIDNELIQYSKDKWNKPSNRKRPVRGQYNEQIKK